QMQQRDLSRLTSDSDCPQGVESGPKLLMSRKGGKRTYAPAGSLFVDWLIKTIPQCDWPAGDRGNVDALLTKQHGTSDAANEPHAYRTEDVRLHRCLLARRATDGASRQNERRMA